MIKFSKEKVLLLHQLITEEIGAPVMGIVSAIVLAGAALIVAKKHSK